MLSNGVLERAFFRSRARGVVPGSARCLLPMAQSKGRDAKFFPVRAAIAAASAKDSDPVALIRAGQGMCGDRRASWPCRKAVRHVHRGECPHHSCPGVSTSERGTETQVGRPSPPRKSAFSLPFLTPSSCFLPSSLGFFPPSLLFFLPPRLGADIKGVKDPNRLCS